MAKDTVSLAPTTSSQVSAYRHISPTDSIRVTSAVGVRADAIPAEHTGIDIAALTPGIKGDALYAIADGTILDIRKTASGVSVLELKQLNGDTAVYMHGDYSGMKKGQAVKQGDTVCTMSDVGSGGSVHLHFEIRKNGLYVKQAADAQDPLKQLPNVYTSRKLGG